MKKTVQLIVEIDVEVDEAKFTPEFMETYRSYINRTAYDIDDHIKQLAYVGVRDEPSGFDFVEGYGPIDQMGIKIGEPDFVEIEIT